MVRSDSDEECLVIGRDETSQSWKTHGIIAAQRQDNGQLWVVVAGLEGPASLGAAKEVASLDGVPSDDVMQYYVTHEVHIENAPSEQKKDARELGRLVKKQQWFMNGTWLHLASGRPKTVLRSRPIQRKRPFPYLRYHR